MTPSRSTPVAAIRLLEPVLCAVLVGWLLVATAGTAQASDPQPTTPVGGPLLGSPGVVVALAPGVDALPKVSAKSFLLADLESGAVLAAKNPHGKLAPASAIKVLTAVTLLPRLDPDQVYRATFEDANVEGSRVGIVPGGTYTVHNLFEGLFLTSGNDAARALAGAAGGLGTTVRQMNETARRLGALDTTARNASGLDEPGQFSSAYDLALFGRAGMARADFRTYAKTVKSRFPGKPEPGKTRKSFEIYTQNKLVLNYPGAIGIKTGWTTQARGTFIGAATRDGRTLLVTVMNTSGGAWREAAALLDWGFANATAVEPVGTLTTAPAAARRAPERTAAADTHGAGTAARTASTASRSSWSWLRSLVGWLIVALLGAVLTLRMRVVVRQHRRMRRRAALAAARRDVDFDSGLPPAARDRQPPLPERSPPLGAPSESSSPSRVGRSA